MNDLTIVTSVRVSQRILAETMLHLRRVGAKGFEGIALWAGVQRHTEFDVLDLLVPKQRASRTRDGVCVAIGPEELHRINVWLFQNNRTLLAQVHSHPTNAYHSETDDDFCVATTMGSLSIVVPDFAARPFSFQTAAVCRLDAKGRWTRLPPSVACSLITLLE